MGVDTLDDAISAAAFDPLKWRDVCDLFATATRSVGARINPSIAELAGTFTVCSQSIAEAERIYVSEQWHLRDVRYRGARRIHTHGWLTDEHSVEYDEVSRIDYYQDFLKRTKLKWFAGVGFGPTGGEWVVSIQRSENADPFTAREVELLLPKRRLLCTSAIVARELGMSRLRGAADVMEQQGKAVIALNDEGRVVLVSARADALIGDAIRISGGSLRALHDGAQSSLQRLVAAITHPRNPGAPPARLARRSGKPALVVYGLRLAERERDIFTPASALLVIVDPSKPVTVPPEFLAQYFDITPAEALLALSALDGMPLDQHAAARGISVLTARNQLQSLLAKTGTHSKAELVALLAKVVPR